MAKLEHPAQGGGAAATMSSDAATALKPRPVEAEAKEPAPTPPPAQHAPAHAEAHAPRAKAPARRGPLILAILGLGVAGFAAVKGTDYWTTGRFMVSTDDAYVTADVTQIAGKVSGHVVSVAVSANQAVKAGDVLVTLDRGDYTLALSSAEAKLATQEATIRRIGEQITAARAQADATVSQRDATAADLALAEASLTRLASLEQSAVSSRASLDTATRDRRKAAAALATADAQIAAAKANIAVLEAQAQEAERVSTELGFARDQAKRNLDFAVIRAPIDGVVGNLAVQVGNYVQPGQRLASLVPLGEVHIDANFKETQLATLKPGQEVHIKVDAYPGLDIKGRLDSFAPATGSVFSLLPAQNATGNFTKVVQRVPVRITLPKEALASGKLYPGLSVEVDADTRAH